jgi:hypothetical protein
MKHTKGLWAVLPLEGKYYGTKVQVGENTIEVWTPDHFNFKPSERQIAEGYDPKTDGHDHVEDERSLANASLIAAAPDLLEALRAMQPEKYALHKLSAEILAQAESALKKAKGE